MCQHACGAGHSNRTAMTQMSESWFTSIDRSMLVGTVMTDFSAAFEMIDHNLLIDELICYGFESSAGFMQVRSYLSSRSQSVF